MGKLYFCRHQWVGGTCVHCGRDRSASTSSQGLGGGGCGEIPDWAGRLQDGAHLRRVGETRRDTAYFDPWVNTSLGPSVVLAPPVPKAPASPTADRPSFDAAGEERMLALVNQARAREGLVLLEMDEALRTVARSHSAAMRTQGFFEHVDPEGRQPADRVLAAGIRFMALGENIARGAQSVEGFHGGFMNSPGHRANIVNPGFVRVGIGIETDQDGHRWVTQDFAA